MIYGFENLFLQQSTSYLDGRVLCLCNNALLFRFRLIVSAFFTYLCNFKEVKIKNTITE